GPRGAVAGRRGCRAGRRPAALPVHPRGHDLRRFGRDRAQHHRRARARPAEGGTPVIPQTVSLKNVPGHDLLAGKVVVVTAAAGTGIGSAVAKRCLEEGASVVVSDWHERRLGEKAAELAEAGKVHAIPCDVTKEDQVQALIDGAVDHFGRLDVLVNNAGLGGTKSVLDMTDD